MNYPLIETLQKQVIMRRNAMQALQPEVTLERQKLLTAEIRNRLPPLYSTEQIPDDEKVIQAKFFTPWTYWTWYAVEFNGDDTFFGLICGHEREWGYFSLSELESVKGPFGLYVERDIHFKPTKVKDLAARGERCVHLRCSLCATAFAQSTPDYLLEGFADDFLLPVMMEYSGDWLDVSEIRKLLKKHWKDDPYMRSEERAINVLLETALTYLEDAGEVISRPDKGDQPKRWTAIKKGELANGIALTDCEKKHKLGPKLESCVRSIKSGESKPANPYAVCRAAISAPVCSKR